MQELLHELQIVKSGIKNSCKHADQDKQKSPNPRPEYYLRSWLHTIGNDGMYNPYQTADTKADASINPELK